MRAPAGVVDDRTYAAWADLESHLESKRAAPTTIAGYGWSLVQFWEWGGGRCALDATHEDVNGYLSWLAESGSSASTCETRYRHLKRMFRYWLRAEYITRDPMPLVGAPRLTEKLVPVVPPDDMAALLKACEGRSWDDKRDNALIRIALNPGAPRATELVTLTMDQVDIKAGVLLIHGKGGVDRLLPLGPLAKQALLRYLAVRPQSGYLAGGQHTQPRKSERVFLGKYGPITREGLRFIVRRRAELAGIGHVYPHQLRHTSAARCKGARMDPETARLLFGWSANSAMYARYGRAVAGALAVEHGREYAAELEAQ